MSYLKRVIYMLILGFVWIGVCDSPVCIKASETEVITGFSEFDVMDHALYFSLEEKPSLDEIVEQMPEQLKVYLNDSQTPEYIDVDWFEVLDEYEEENRYYYQFSPCWDEKKYVLSEDIDLLTGAPYIAVHLQDSTIDPKVRAVTSKYYEPLIFEYFTETLGYDVATACGLMANIYCESSFIPTNLQNSYEKTLGYTDETYTKAVDDKTYTNFVRDKAGYGFCQWTYWSLKESLLNYAAEKGTSIGDWSMQLEFLGKEIKRTSKVNALIKASQNNGQSAYDIGHGFCYYYERPANYQTVAVTRGNLARDKYWAEYGNEDEMFKDIDVSSYYYNAVLWAVENEITYGTSENYFEPDGTCTRAQAVTFLWRVLGKEKVTDVECSFTDVEKNSYYYDAVLWAVQKGITKGKTKTEFDPEGKVTRAEFVTFLWRAEQEVEIEGENPFTDVQEESYYYDAVLWAVQKGITKGTTETEFAPDDNCNRAQVVTFLYRAYEE